MKTSEIFRRARKRLERGFNATICRAIEDLRGANYFEKQYARRAIMARLFPFGVVELWARATPGEMPGANQATPSDFREFRIRWLHALEAEFKARGD